MCFIYIDFVVLDKLRVWIKVSLVKFWFDFMIWIFKFIVFVIVCRIMWLFYVLVLDI